jgi:hypothetical protein
MNGIWRATHDGDLAEVERLVGQDPGVLNAVWFIEVLRVAGRP